MRVSDFHSTVKHLTLLAIVACVSAVLFYWYQFKLVTSLYHMMLDFEEQAKMWRKAFIEKKNWY